MERALEREALEYPAIDLYGEDSWTDWVNPFAGKSSPRIPATYNIDCSGFVMPLEGTMRVTSNYGYRARYRREHKGIDLALRTGDDVRAAFDGKVRIRGYERGGYGNYIVIRHPNGLETVYGHMSRCIAKEGQIVRAGEVIGKGGSVIQKIVAESGAKIDIDDDGTIHIASADAAACDAAKKCIDDIVFVPEVGKLYYGRVVRLMQFGAFVEIAPGKDGLVHISKLDKKRVEKVEDVVTVGDMIWVKFMEIDEKGRWNLSRKDALLEIEAQQAAAAKEQ